MKKDPNDDLFCGEGREEELLDTYEDDVPYFVSIDDVDFEQEEDDEEDNS